MYIERNVFYLQFGAGKAALELWRAYLETARQADPGLRARLLTDLSGPAYVLVLELAYDSYAELEPALCRLTRLAGWREFYERFVPLCKSSERTLYKEAAI